MKYIHFLYQGETSWGVVEGDDVWICDGNISEGFTKTGEKRKKEDISLLTPGTPSKILCVGLNYLDHIHEFDKEIPDSPVIFMKPETTLLPPFGAIIHPPISDRMDFEGELAVVIGKTAKNISEDEAKDYIFGYTCANDVTARDLQPMDGQWILAKGFDTFLPLGPWIETELDTSNLLIRTLLNGEVKQSSNTSYLLFKPEMLVSYLSSYMTLYPGDVILTGTSSGVGPMKSGDTVVVEIEGIGSLENTVR